MKLFLVSILCIGASSRADESPQLSRLRARILQSHQSFLNLKNEYYSDLPEHLVKVSFQCADNRDIKACNALVKGIKAFIDEQKKTCPPVIEQAVCLLAEHERVADDYAICIKHNDDNSACEALRDEAAALFLRLAELNATHACCVGIEEGLLSLLSLTKHDVYNALHKRLCEQRKGLAHDRPELLFRARMLYYTVGEYRGLRQISSSAK